MVEGLFDRLFFDHPFFDQYFAETGGGQGFQRFNVGVDLFDQILTVFNQRAQPVLQGIHG